MRRTLFFIIFSAAVALGQGQDVCPSCTVLGGHLVAGGNAILGNFGASAGLSSPTVYMGLPGASPDYLGDSDNGLFEVDISFTTPPSMTNPSWGVPEMYWLTPDSSNPNWGMILRSDASCQGTVTTSGATVTWVSGTTPSSCQFNTTYWGSGTPFELCPTVNTCALYLLNGTPGSATSLTLSTTPGTGCASACPFLAYSSGASLCTSNSTSVASSGWNAAPPNWSCANVPASSTRYWLGFFTASTSQQFYDNNGNPCEYENGMPVFAVIGEATSFPSWPTKLVGTTNYQVDNGDGCLGAYIPLTYSTANRYTLVTSAPVTCDVGAPTCRVYIPPVPSNATILTVSLANGASAIPNLSAIDYISGVSTDTLTKRGSCPGVTVGGNPESQMCFYEIDRATAGVNQVTCTNSAPAGNKSGCLVVVITGTQATSFDQVCYDSVGVATATFTGCSTSTTSVANEITFGMAVNANAYTCCPYNGTYMGTTAGSWTTLFSGGYTNTSAMPFGLFYKVLTSTQTVNVVGDIIGATGSPGITTGVITLE